MQSSIAKSVRTKSRLFYTLDSYDTSACVDSLPYVSTAYTLMFNGNI